MSSNEGHDEIAGKQTIQIHVWGGFPKRVPHIFDEIARIILGWKIDRGDHEVRTCIIWAMFGTCSSYSNE